MSKPQPLWAYNQLMRVERRQIKERPADEKEPRYFMFGMAIYDVHDFVKVVGLDWATDGDGVLKVQTTQPGWVLVERMKP